MKTLQELNDSTDDDLRVIIAELQGYVRRPDGFWQEAGHVGSCGIPNYPGDLDACHKVVMSLPVNSPFRGVPDRTSYRVRLRQVCNHPHHTHYADATARQRTIALILTLQKP